MLWSVSSSFPFLVSYLLIKFFLDRHFFIGDNLIVFAERFQNFDLFTSSIQYYKTSDPFNKILFERSSILCFHLTSSLFPSNNEITFQYYFFKQTSITESPCLQSIVGSHEVLRYRNFLDDERLHLNMSTCTVCFAKMYVLYIRSFLSFSLIDSIDR